jgi:hypothetical protein
LPRGISRPTAGVLGVDFGTESKVIMNGSMKVKSNLQMKLKWEAYAKATSNEDVHAMSCWSGEEVFD